MPERRYTDDEVHRILSDAVEVDSSLVDASAGGLTLAQIQRVAAEAGLSATSVTAAAATLDLGARAPAPPRLLGFPLGVVSTVALPGTLRDAEWRRLVSFLQDTFEARGREELVAGRREWRNGNLRVALEDADGATLLFLRTRKESARALVRGGGVLLAGSGVVAAAGVIAQQGVAALAGVAAMALGGAVMAAAGAFQLPSWAATRRRQFQAVTDYARRLSARPAGMEEPSAGSRSLPRPGEG